jgi:hypothetical protein
MPDLMKSPEPLGGFDGKRFTSDIAQQVRGLKAGVDDPYGLKTNPAQDLLSQPMPDLVKSTEPLGGFDGKRFTSGIAEQVRALNAGVDDPYGLKTNPAQDLLRQPMPDLVKSTEPLGGFDGKRFTSDIAQQVRGLKAGVDDPYALKANPAQDLLRQPMPDLVKPLHSASWKNAEPLVPSTGSSDLLKDAAADQKLRDVLNVNPIIGKGYANPVTGLRGHRKDVFSTDLIQTAPAADQDILNSNLGRTIHRRLSHDADLSDTLKTQDIFHREKFDLLRSDSIGTDHTKDLLGPPRSLFNDK